MQFNKGHRNAGTRRRSAMGLVEVMISLAIAATLLTAAAAAFTASARAVEANDTFFRASQAARVSLNQILTEVRRSWSVDVVSANQINMETHDLRDRSYVYDSTTQTLKLVTNDVTTDPDYTLCNNVTTHAFSSDTVTDSNGISHTVRVSVTLVVKVGENSVRLTGSAAPRRKQHLGAAP
jgi:type II secretory pathway pseudopilin PulG